MCWFLAYFRGKSKSSGSVTCDPDKRRKDREVAWWMSIFEINCTPFRVVMRATSIEIFALGDIWRIGDQWSIDRRKGCSSCRVSPRVEFLKNSFWKKSIRNLRATNSYFSEIWSTVFGWKGIFVIVLFGGPQQSLSTYLEPAAVLGTQLNSSFWSSRRFGWI